MAMVSIEYDPDFVILSTVHTHLLRLVIMMSPEIVCSDSLDIDKINIVVRANQDHDLEDMRMRLMQ